MWGDKAKTALNDDSASDMFIMVEHHEPVERVQVARSAAKNRGWLSRWTPATSSGAGGTHGGTAIFTRSTYQTAGLYAGDAVPVDMQTTAEGKETDFTVTIVQLRGMQVAFLAIYFDDTVGMAEGNLAKAAALSEVIGMLNCPWCITGDWNMTPAELASTGWVDEIHGRLLCPKDVEATCSSGQGRLLDYAVISPLLVPHVQSFGEDPQAAWKPHLGLRLVLDRHPRLVMYPQLKKPQGKKRHQEQGGTTSRVLQLM